MRSHPTPAAAALLAETDSSMNSACIKENGVSERTPMQIFIDALTLAPSLEPPTAAHAVSQIKRPLVQSIRRGRKNQKFQSATSAPSRFGSDLRTCHMGPQHYEAGHTKAPDPMLAPKRKSLHSTGASPHETHPIQHSALSFHLSHP